MSRKTRTQKNKHRTAGAAGAHRPSRLVWVVGAIGGIALIVIAVIFYAYRAAPESAASAVATATPTRLLITGPGDDCRRQPTFAQTLGFSQQALIGTGQIEPKGLALFEMGADGQPERTYQDPTWDDAGWLGYITLDRMGNLFVFPAPRENLVDNPPEKANIIYRVDSTSAQMTSFITLTAGAPLSPANPYGILGMTLDCDTESLYVSTVAGSTRADEAGKIVRVALATPVVAAEYPGVDAFGLAIYRWPEGRRLYYGLARTADLYSIGLDDDGSFTGEPRYELSLPDANFKAWRLRFLQDGDLQIRGLEFDFNLKATSERQEVNYTFRRDPATGEWAPAPPV
jgi:hypothetical protein